MTPSLCIYIVAFCVCVSLVAIIEKKWGRK